MRIDNLITVSHRHAQLRCLTVVATAVAAAAIVARAQEPGFDLLIRNGRVIDGTGNPWYRADIAVRGDTIARIAPRIDAPAVRTIDTRGQVIAPGFIDIHSHARTTISMCALEGGREATLKRIQDARSRAEILADTIALLRDARGGGDPQNVRSRAAPGIHRSAASGSAT